MEEDILPLSELIYKYFKDERTIWFDYIDSIKIGYDVKQKGISYSKQQSQTYLICIIGDDGEEVIFDLLREPKDGRKLVALIDAFKC